VLQQLVALREHLISVSAYYPCGRSSASSIFQSLEEELGMFARVGFLIFVLFELRDGADFVRIPFLYAAMLLEARVSDVLLEGLSG
jgi:hypothetical protein